MEQKEWMLTDVEFLPIPNGVHTRFYYKLWGSKDQKCIDNPSIEWLVDFVSMDKPYELHLGKPWHMAFDCALAQKTLPNIEKMLSEKKIMTDDELCDLFEKTCTEYYPKMAECRHFRSDDFLQYIAINAEKVWKWKGE